MQAYMYSHRVKSTLACKVQTLKEEEGTGKHSFFWGGFIFNVPPNLMRISIRSM